MNVTRRFSAVRNELPEVDRFVPPGSRGTGFPTVDDGRDPLADRHKRTDSALTRMGDLTLVRTDGTWHRTDILGCSYVDVAPVDEERTVDREALSDLDRCSTCTW